MRSRAREARWIGNEALRLAALAIQAQLVDQQLPPIQRRRRKIPLSAGPLFEERGGQISGASSCDESPQRSQSVLLVKVTAAEGALMRHEILDGRMEWSPYFPVTHKKIY